MSSEKTDKQETGVVLITEKTIDAGYNASARFMEDCVKNLNAVQEIKDDATFERVNLIATDMNKALNLVDDAHKILKAPYLSASQKIDKRRNEIKKNGEDALAIIRPKLAAYQREQNRKLQEAEREKEKKRKEAEENEQNETNRINGIKTRINTIETDALLAIKKAESLLDLKNVHETHVKGFPAPEEFAEFATVAAEVKKRILQIGKAKDTWMRAIKAALPAAQQEEAKKFYFELLGQHLVENDAQKAVVENIAKNAIDEVQEQTEMTKAAITTSPVLQSSTKLSDSVKWVPELVDWTKVPDDWKCLDENATKKYVKENKQALYQQLLDNPDIETEGIIVNGVKFMPEGNVRIAKK